MTSTRILRLRQLLWLYFWLLLFEGALRRWFLPGLSNVLLLVRDPVALLAVWWAWPLLRQRRWYGWMLTLLVIGSLAFLMGVTLGHGDLFIAFYGVRVFLLQLPLIFVFASVFTRDDVIRFAWVMVLLCIPMTLLIATQSNLPSSHLLNVGPGGLGTSVFAGAGGRFRPPGTFTFITGVSSFFTLAVASLFCVLYCHNNNQRQKLICLIAGIALVVALPVSISRSLLAGYLQVLTATVAALLLSRTRIVPLLSGLLAVVLAIVIGSNIPAFKETSGAFLARWDRAAGIDREAAGDVGVAGHQLQNRVLAGYTKPLGDLDSVPLAGYGIGIGTNVGAQRLTGELTFVVGERAWEASLKELGLPLGLTFLIWRVALTFFVLVMSLKAAVRGNRVPLILVGASFLDLLGGQLSQPTGLGFIVISSGLTLAGCNSSIAEKSYFSHRSFA